jgi:hypothetical protein
MVQHYDAPLVITTCVIPEPSGGELQSLAAAVGKRSRSLVRTPRHHP